MTNHSSNLTTNLTLAGDDAHPNLNPKYAADMWDEEN